MRKFLQGLRDCFGDIPFAGIVFGIFSGEFGWRTPVAFVLQLALQIYCAVAFLPTTVGGTIFVAVELVVLNLFTGLLIGVQPLSGFGPTPVYKSMAEFARFAILMSLFVTIVGGVIAIGPAACLSHATMAAFAECLALSALGGTAIHMFGVALPIYRYSTRNQKKDKS
jgi:hypothetical protein